jgi:hypothetical protein
VWCENGEVFLDLLGCGKAYVSFYNAIPLNATARALSGKASVGFSDVLR